MTQKFRKSCSSFENDRLDPEQDRTYFQLHWERIDSCTELSGTACSLSASVNNPQYEHANFYIDIIESSRLSFVTSERKLTSVFLPQLTTKKFKQQSLFTQ